MVLKEIIKLAELDKQLHDRSTGNATQLAKRVGISRSTLFKLFKELGMIGAEIGYDTKKRTYYYKKRVQIFFSITKEAGTYLLLDDIKRIVGGNGPLITIPKWRPESAAP